MAPFHNLLAYPFQDTGIETKMRSKPISMERPVLDAWIEMKMGSHKIQRDQRCKKQREPIEFDRLFLLPQVAVSDRSV